MPLPSALSPPRPSTRAAVFAVAVHNDAARLCAAKNAFNALYGRGILVIHLTKYMNLMTKNPKAVSYRALSYR